MARCILLASLLVGLAAGATPAFAACPAKFDAFLERFESDRKFHLESVRFPLPMTYLDANGDTPVKHRTRLSRREYSLPRQPWYPPPALQDEWSLARTVRDVSKTRKVVRLEQIEVDGYKAEFHFQKAGACWRLVLMDDQWF